MEAEYQDKHCISCGSKLMGRFCSNCGEKLVHTKDFSLFSILQQAIGFITNFDSKLFKSFFLLFLKPGKLTEEYVIGRRKPYMNPFQIFVISNILFFIFLVGADIFRAPSKWFFPNEAIAQEVDQISRERNLTTEEIALLYDTKSTNLSKGIIAVFIPVIGLLFALIQYRKRLLYGIHVIFAVHFFSFFLMFAVLLAGVIALLPTYNKYFIQIPLVLAIFFYIFFASIRFYKDSIGWAAAKSIISTIIILTLLISYRWWVSYLSLQLI